MLQITMNIINSQQQNLHSSEPMISMINSSPNIFSKIWGLLSKTASNQIDITYYQQTMRIEAAHKEDIIVEWKLLLTNPFDYFIYHVKTINVFQVFTDSKQVNQLSEKFLLHQKKCLENY